MIRTAKMEERVNADNANVKTDLSVNVANSKTVTRENVLMRKKSFVVELEMQLAQVRQMDFRLTIKSTFSAIRFNNFTKTSNILVIQERESVS